ncbi:MAG TPA: hypothetical protein VIH54_06520, partial [Chthoniobacterales bacterium]
NRPHQGIQGTKGKEPLLVIGPLGTAGRSQEGLNAVAAREDGLSKKMPYGRLRRSSSVISVTSCY